MDIPGLNRDLGNSSLHGLPMADPIKRGGGRVPGYLSMVESGELAERAFSLRTMLRSCTLCPRHCRVDRTSGHRGACGVDARPMVAAMSVHPWEEPPISGFRGSGAIFFSGCSLKCVFCQNYPISQMGVGRTIEVRDLAKGMLELQRKGVHNINLVTATHQVHAVVEALLLAVPQGFRLPLVYNTSGYEDLGTLRLLEGIVDIYLPDIKYADPVVAHRYSGRWDYVRKNRVALLEMWRQVGSLAVDAEGLAFRGLLIRHLVLPGGLSGSRRSLAFLAREIGPEVWVSLMMQYFPAYRAHDYEPINRKVTEEEYEEVFELLGHFGLENGFVQSTLNECL